MIPRPLSSTFGSGSSYAAGERSLHHQLTPTSPENFEEFIKQALGRVYTNLSDAKSWVEQLGFMWAGDIAGYGARVALRKAKVFARPVLTVAQITADESLTATYTQRYRTLDQKNAWLYEVVEGLSARTALHLGLKFFNRFPMGGVVLRSLVSGGLLTLGIVIGERITKRMGSVMPITPLDAYSLGLRLVDAQTVMVKGATIKQGSRLMGRLTNHRVSFDSDEIGRWFESHYPSKTEYLHSLTQGRRFAREFTDAVNAKLKKHESRFHPWDGEHASVNHAILRMIKRVDAEDKIAYQEKLAQHQQTIADNPYLVKTVNRALKVQSEDLVWKGEDITNRWRMPEYLMAMRGVLDQVDALDQAPALADKITATLDNTGAPDVKSDAYFDYLANNTKGLRTLYPIADVDMAREVLGDSNPEINEALKQGKLPLVYLDGGASTKEIPTVEATGRAIMEHYANTHGHSHNPVRITDHYYHLAHDILLRYAGYETGLLGSHTALFVGQGATDAINHVARLLFEKRQFQRVEVYHQKPTSNWLVQKWRSMGVVVRDFAFSFTKGLGRFQASFKEAFIEPLQRLANRLFPFVNFENARDTVIFSGLGHHANLIPWQVHAPRSIAVPLQDKKTGRINFDQLRQVLRDNKGRVKLLSIFMTSNVTGLVSDLKQAAQMAHEAGGKIFVDGAHSAHAMGAIVEGVGRVCPGEANVDFLAGSGHKMYAPGSPGWLIMRKEFSPDIPVRLGGGIVEDVYYDRAYFTDDLPTREEAGTPPIPNSIRLASALLTMEAIGKQRIWDHELKLTTQTIAGFDNIKDVRVAGDTQLNRTARAGVVTFNVEGMHHAVLSAALSDYANIATRNGCFCAQPYVKELIDLDDFTPYVEDIRNGDWSRIPGLVRASYGIYNTPQDAAYLLKWVDAIAKRKDEINALYTIDKSGVAHHKHKHKWMQDPTQEPIYPFKIT